MRPQKKSHISLVALSVNFHCCIDLPDEGVRSIATNGPSKQPATCMSSSFFSLNNVCSPKCEDHDEGVGEIEQCGHKFINLELRAEIKNAIGENIDR